RAPSLSIGIGDDGRVLVRCFAGCTHKDVVAALNLTEADLFPPHENGNTKRPDSKLFNTAADAVADLERQQGKRSGLWTYHDEYGEPVGLIVRIDHHHGKTIRPVSRRGPKWIIGAMPTPRPLYGLPELLASQGTVYITEGEKAADAARSITLTVTTSPGG